MQTSLTDTLMMAEAFLSRKPSFAANYRLTDQKIFTPKGLKKKKEPISSFKINSRPGRQLGRVISFISLLCFLQDVLRYPTAAAQTLYCSQIGRVYLHCLVFYSSLYNCDSDHIAAPALGK